VNQRLDCPVTCINQQYLDENNLKVEILGRGITWLDTGTFEGLNDASTYIRTLENRQGLKVACPEEIAWRLGWIKDKDIIELANEMKNSDYGAYLKDIIKEN